MHIHSAVQNLKVLLSQSTRIRGLVPGAIEVQVSLLSLQQSIEMLIRMSGVSVDTGSASAELMQISTLCARLPLTISIAAGAILIASCRFKKGSL
jgi:hypothetical protein